jgi:hypothetical protein
MNPLLVTALAALIGLALLMTWFLWETRQWNH